MSEILGLVYEYVGVLISMEFYFEPVFVKDML